MSDSSDASIQGTSRDANDGDMPDDLDPSDTSDPVGSLNFVRGGKVQAAAKGIYVVRRADADLVETCMAGDFGVVLHSRQVGKSSLIAHVASVLREKGAKAIVIDLTKIGTKALTAEQWYLAVLDFISDKAGFSEFDIVAWWDQQERFAPVYRLFRFFSGPLLERVKERVVIFVDEIDTTLKLDFTDDFFAVVRDLYQGRDELPELKRLSFVVSGSSTPDELMKDASRTPFNIGVRVNISDFTLEESLQLAAGFRGDEATARAVVEKVYGWTSGHPYLTQAVCSAVARATSDRAAQLSPASVGRILNETLLGPTGSQDDNLNYVREMLTTRADKIVGAHQVLLAYRQIVRGAAVKDDPQSPIHAHLKLSGVVVSVAGRLRVRNRIYKEVFGKKWLREQLPIDLRWVTGISVGLTALSVIGWLYNALVIVPARRLDDEVRINVDGLQHASEESDATRLYSAIKSHVDVVHRVTNPATTPERLYEDFWNRRGSRLLELATRASNRDDGLLLRALAAFKQGRALDTAIIGEFNRRFDGAFAVLREHRGLVLSASFSSSGELITGGADDVVNLWEPGTAQGRGWASVDTEFTVRPLAFESSSHTRYVPNWVGAYATEAGTFVTAASQAGLVMAWRLEGKADPVIALRRNTQPAREQDVQIGQLESFTPTSAIVAPDGKRLLVTGGGIQLLRMGEKPIEGTVLETHPVKPKEIAWNGDFSNFGGYIAIPAGRRADVLKANLQSFRHFDEEAMVTQVTFSEDGRRLLSTTERKATLWDVETSRPQAQLTHPLGSVVSAWFCCKSSTQGVCAQRNGPEDAVATVASAPGEQSVVRYWTLPDGVLGTERVYPGAVAAISADCSMVATVGGAVDGAPLEGVILRNPLRSVRAPQDDGARLVQWQKILRRRVTSEGDVVPFGQTNPTLTVPSGPPAKR